MKTSYIAATAVATVALVAAAYFTLQSEPEPAIEIPVVTEPLPIQRTEPEPAAEAETEVVEPTEPPATVEESEPLQAAPESLDNSDPQVLSLVTELSPKLTSWLLPQQQLRKWVLTIDMLADGNYPRKYQPLNYPMAKFDVDKHDERIIAAEKNQQRISALLDAITAIPADTLAEYYLHWYPILEKAYAEQGKPGSFDGRINTLAERLLAHRALPADALLKQPHVFYQYQDKALEQASELDKLLWRLGPENSKRIQDYARAFIAAQ